MAANKTELFKFPRTKHLFDAANIISPRGGGVSMG